MNCCLNRCTLTEGIRNHILSLNWGYRVQLKEKYIRKEEKREREKRNKGV
jgi:hypothetical protein